MDYYYYWIGSTSVRSRWLHNGSSISQRQQQHSHTFTTSTHTHTHTHRTHTSTHRQAGKRHRNTFDSIARLPQPNESRKTCVGCWLGDFDCHCCTFAIVFESVSIPQHDVIFKFPFSLYSAMFRLIFASHTYIYYIDFWNVDVFNVHTQRKISIAVSRHYIYSFFSVRQKTHGHWHHLFALAQNEKSETHLCMRTERVDISMKKCRWLMLCLDWKNTALPLHTHTHTHTLPCNFIHMYEKNHRRRERCTCTALAKRMPNRMNEPNQPSRDRSISRERQFFISVCCLVSFIWAICCCGWLNTKATMQRNGSAKTK